MVELSMKYDQIIHEKMIHQLKKDQELIDKRSSQCIKHADDPGGL